MQSDTAQSQSGRNSGEAREPVVRRKVVVGKSRVGTGGKRVDKGAAQEQKRDIIQVNGITGRNNRGKAGDSQQWKQTTKNSLTEFKLTVGKEKQSGNERKTGERVKKMEKTETTGRLIKEEKDNMEGKKGGGDGEAILQKAEEEKKNNKFSAESMQSNTAQSQSGRNSGEAREPVVRRKAVTSKSTGGKRVDKGATQEQKRDIIQVNGITGRNNRGKAGDSQQWKQTTKSSLTEFKLTVGKEKQSGHERKTGERVKKMEKTETTGRLIKEEKDNVEGKKGGGDGEAILQKAEEEKKKNTIEKTLLRTKNNQSFVVEDYLQLLKLLKIKLPQGVLTLEVIKHSTDPKVTRDAQAIVQDLEKFQLKFITNPRLGCREVKHALNLKKNGDAQEITRVIFFESTKDSETTLRKTWETNVSNTGHGFRMRDKYRTTPVSTPVMYATAETRSWRRFESGKDIARITNGVRVNVQELEKMEFCDESLINQAQSSPQRFGRFLINPADEKECLKFFHELREMKNYEKLTYTKGNKVEFGFLTGNVDFLADARLKTGSAKSEESSTQLSEKIIIECKGTTGDMVDKLFTKPHDGSHKAQFIETHEYCYQTQAYMYILKKVKLTPPTVRGVMVVRHYHNDSSISKDFYWNYLKEDHTKQIDALIVYCQKEALPRFLAVLCFIFQKETDTLKKP